MKILLNMQFHMNNNKSLFQKIIYNHIIIYNIYLCKKHKKVLFKTYLKF